MKKQHYLLLILSFVFIFSSCKKYEDGPAVSLLTKTSRLTGEWEVTEIDKDSDFGNWKLLLTFEKNGDFTFTAIYTGSYDYDDVTENGEWEWESGKEVVDVTVDNERQEFKITRLTNDELWFEDKDDNYTEWRCEKQ